MIFSIDDEILNKDKKTPNPYLIKLELLFKNS